MRALTPVVRPRFGHPVAKQTELDASAKGWVNQARYADTWRLREKVLAPLPSFYMIFATIFMGNITSPIGPVNKPQDSQRQRIRFGQDAKFETLLTWKLNRSS